MTGRSEADDNRSTTKAQRHKGRKLGDLVVNCLAGLLAGGGEDFFEQIRRAGNGVFPDLLFFGGHHLEETIERFLGDVTVEVGIVLAEELGHGAGFLDELFVRGGHAGLFRGGFDNGEEFFGELGGAGLAEVLGGGVGRAFEDGLSVGDGHLFDGVGEDGGRGRDGLFGGVVEGGVEFVSVLFLAHGAQAFFNGAEFLGDGNLDVEVFEEAAVFAELRDSLGDAFGEGFFETIGDFGFGQRRQGGGGVGCRGGFLEEVEPVGAQVGGR